MADQELLDTFDEKYPGHRVQITEQRLETISEVCQEVHGEEFARRCIARIRETGYITPVQRYFGLHYRADELPKGNDDFLKLMEEFGFDWFKTYQAVEKQD
jgi:FMN reductase [NAD(P)H]